MWYLDDWVGCMITCLMRKNVHHPKYSQAGISDHHLTGVIYYQPKLNALLVGMFNHLLSIILRFHYHSQEVIGSLGIKKCDFEVC